MFSCQTRDQPQPIRNLLFTDPAEGATEFQRRDDIRSIAEKELDVIRQLIAFIEMTTDHHHRPVELLANGSDNGRDTRSPQTGSGRDVLLCEGFSQVFE